MIKLVAWCCAPGCKHSLAVDVLSLEGDHLSVAVRYLVIHAAQGAWYIGEGSRFYCFDCFGQIPVDALIIE